MAKTKFYVDVTRGVPLHAQQLMAVTHPYSKCPVGYKRYVFGVDLPDIDAEPLPVTAVSPVHEYKPDVEPCPHCGEPRYPSPSGLVCKNGHGG